MTCTAILGGRLVDPGNGVDQILDIFLADGRVAAIGPAPDGFHADRTIDARDHVVCPGLIDICARLREPGLEHKADITSETRAAAAGGVTTVCCPPDTDPIIDTPAVVELIQKRALDAGYCQVETMGALTRGLAGEHLAEMAALNGSGCVAMTNALQPIVSAEVMRRAMQYAATFDLTVVVHAEDPSLSRDRLVHDGEVATYFGLAGAPETAETVTLARDLLLAEETGARVHVRHLSTARGAAMVREARARGLPVTADVAIGHLFLVDTDNQEFDSLYHVRPPFRGKADAEALRAGVADGGIQAIASDHEPHEPDAKLDPFALTEPGISTLELLLPLSVAFAARAGLNLGVALAAVTSGPAQVLRLNRGHLAPGAPADVCIFRLDAPSRIDRDRLVSRGHNTPFHDWSLPARISHTLLAGRTVFSADA